MINDLMELCETLNTRISDAKKREQRTQDLMNKGDDVKQLRTALGLEKDDAGWREFEENRFNKEDQIYFDERVSMLERTALKYYPIIQEIAKRMTRHKENLTNDYA